MKTNASMHTVRQALQDVNEAHNYELTFKTLEYKGRNVTFTLSAKSGAPGSRDAASGRRGPYASWHAHGHVMDRIFKIEPDTFIRSLGKKYEAGFEWEDKKVGSTYNPVMFSELSNF